MKPTVRQIELMDFCQSIISTWKNTNDINSPTHGVDLSEFILADLDWLEDEEQEEFEELLWNLYVFISCMKKQLNTSVKVTDKTGNSCVYENLQVASEMTGLTEQALKIRANKNSIPKDGIRVEWVDPHTKKSYTSRRSKQKGNQLELDIVHKLNEIGYNTCSSRAQNKALDASKVDIYDIDGNLPILIQAKCTQTLPSYFKIREECPIKELPFTMIWKKQDKDGGQSPGTVAIIPVEVLWEYLTLKLIQK